MDSLGQVDFIYMDMQKAFNNIDQTILLSRLDSIGFSAKVINSMEL